MTDREQMAHALRLANGVLHQSAPNPAVGCVLTRDGEIVGHGATQPVGGHHAEIEALSMAGDRSKGAMAYVTLEPCAHHGLTPPCADALIAAGVSQVFVACLDPDPRVDGKGVARLRASGIDVTCGLLELEAQALNRGFISRTLRGRPWVTFKTALSIDGRMATATGESQWISGETSRAEVHRMRRSVDAVLIGAGTARVDNPRLTARLEGEPERVPWRIIMSSRGQLDAGLGLFTDEFTHRTIVLTGLDRDQAPPGVAGSAVQWLTCKSDADGRVDLADGLARLGEFGINQVLCEAGPALATGLWAAHLIDEVICFRAPIILGGDGRSAWNSLNVERLNQVRVLSQVQASMSGTDICEHYLSAAGAKIADAGALVNLREILRT